MFICSAPALIETPGGGASFDGHWEIIAVRKTAVWDESSVVYSAYRCDIGSPFGNAVHALSVS